MELLALAQVCVVAAAKPMWQLRGGRLVHLRDGCFLQAAPEQLGSAALDIIQSTMPVFNAPWHVKEALEAAGVPQLTSTTPGRVRSAPFSQQPTCTTRSVPASGAKGLVQSFRSSSSVQMCRCRCAWTSSIRLTNMEGILSLSFCRDLLKKNYQTLNDLQVIEAAQLFQYCFLGLEPLLDAHQCLSDMTSGEHGLQDVVHLWLPTRLYRSAHLLLACLCQMHSLSYIYLLFRASWLQRLALCILADYTAWRKMLCQNNRPVLQLPWMLMHHGQPCHR